MMSHGLRIPVIIRDLEGNKLREIWEPLMIIPSKNPPKLEIAFSDEEGELIWEDVTLELLHYFPKKTVKYAIGSIDGFRKHLHSDSYIEVLKINEKTYIVIDSPYFLRRWLKP